MTTAIRIESVSKLYRLGTVGTGTISHDLNRWWHQIRGKEDPYAKVGQVNDRTKRATSDEKREASSDSSAIPSPLASSNSPLRASGPDYVWALKDINLEVAQGEILGIIGRNGAGKSTLLKLLSRVTAPTTGSIKAKGRIASLLEVGTGFHPDLTGRENIYMNGAILGMRRHEITRQLDEIVEFSGCAKYLDTPVKRYSSGMTVRLGFSVAAHLQSEILIVDEVLAVGDASFQRSCMGRLDDVAKSGRTVLFVSHNMAAMAALCTRCVILAAGSTAFSGATQEAITTYLYQQRIDCTKKISVSSLPRPEWASERSIEFTEIMIVDPSDISSLSPVLTFRVDVKCSNPVEAFRIGITIYSDLEQPVGSAFTANLGTMHSSDQKTVTLSIKRPRLAPGRYHCSITITRGTIGCEPIPLDSLSNVLHFDVTKDLADVRYREWNRGWGQAVFDIEEHTFAAHLHPEAGAGVKNGKGL